MKRKKRPYKVELSKRAKTLGLMISFGIVAVLFGICWMFIAISMEHIYMVVVGVVMIGIGFSAIYIAYPYADEYNKCVANSLYTTILWNKKNDAKYIIVQDGHGNIIEINNMPVNQEFQTSGRYREEVASEVKT